MTPGQLAQIDALRKCSMIHRDAMILLGISFEPQDKTNKWEEKQLRRLSHQYRHQLAAIRKNRRP